MFKKAPLTCFTARASGGFAREPTLQRLAQSLVQTKQAFFEQFGPREMTEDLFFVRGANRKMLTEVFANIQAMSRRCERENRAFEQVLNAYEGLTTNMLEILRLYCPYRHVSGIICTIA